MTAHAPLHIPAQRPSRVPDGVSTDTLILPAGEPTLDAFHLLDHRARSRSIADGLASPGPHLAIQDGTQTRLLALESTTTHLGRSLTSDVRFEDPRISRTHAIIVQHGRYARLLDNRSAQGTFLNGRRIIAANLGHGDVIRLGPIAMQYLQIR